MDKDYNLKTETPRNSIEILSGSITGQMSQLYRGIFNNGPGGHTAEYGEGERRNGVLVPVARISLVG